MQIKKLIFTASGMATPSYNVQSPVLFLVFNRPDCTQRVFRQIKAARPARLYISADGPRADRPDDQALCKDVRNIISDIGWDCEVKTVFNEENKGCKIAVSSAIDWFFDQEEEGIILEDDCLPADSFFFFCDLMLDKYRTNQRIFCITGSNAQKGIQRGTASYYFSQLANIWGWASWKRVWKWYDRELDRYDEGNAVHFLQNNFADPLLREYWLNAFQRLKKGEVDTWDQQFQYLTFFENGLCVTPNINLISNIGFGEQATHTFIPLEHNAMQPLGEMQNIIHPGEMIPDKEADYFLFNLEFKLDEKRLKIQKDKMLRRRFKRWLRGLFNIKTT
jgi:hypothetical protein